MSIYGSNLGNLALPNSKKHGHERSAVGAWWCPVCELLVRQADNPIECVECGGDMTIAPGRKIRA